MVLKDDATHAYRGYRLQALYILHKLLTNYAGDLIFQPEGAEDLAVYDSDGTLIQIVQIKAHEKALTLSKFKPQKSDSFFYRVNDFLKKSPQAKVTIASFNDFGQRFEKAIYDEGHERDREIAELTKHNKISTEDAKVIFENLHLHLVSESDLHSEIEEWIQSSYVGEASTAIALLQNWIYLCSEKRQKIKFADLRTKLDDVGEYINHQATFHREWFNTIHPLIEEKSHSKQTLEGEFYRGISVKYHHILADLDVIRPQKLELIHKAFQDAQVVIVHGVSGQGKSTLAYRYLHEYVQKQFRFDVHSPHDRSQALSIASAISAHAKVIDYPVTFYIDVRPSETNWTDTVRELAKLSNVHILVTIREDDLRRTQFDDTDFSFGAVELSLEQDEANEIYDYFVEHRQSPDFTDFDDAWRKFIADTTNSPLMEFVYLLTQGESLRTRLKKQIQILQDEVIANKFEPSLLDLLRLISTASAYGARLNRRKLAANLTMRVPKRTFEKLEKEYLISTEETLVDGVHPLRSKILQQLLEDEFTSWEKDITQLFDCIYEPDMGFFLLNLFVSKPELGQNTVDYLRHYSPKTWDGIAGVLRALVWLGVKNFVERNEVILRQAYDRFGIGALMFINSDLLGAVENSQNALDTLADKSEAIAKAMVDAKALSERLEGADEVLGFAHNWLQLYSENTPEIVEEVANWNSLIDTIFWCRHFEVNQFETAWTQLVSNDRILDELSITDLADLSLAISHKHGSTDWHTQRANYLQQRFMEDTTTFAIEFDNHDIENAQLHFVLDYQMMEETQGTKQQNIANNEAVKRVRYFMYLFPEYEKVGSQGYGHRVLDLDVHDETYKAGIPRSAFPMKWLVWGNSIYSGLFYWMLREDNWEVLAQKTIHLRHQIIKTLKKYERELEKYFASQKAYNLFNKLAKRYNHEMIQTLIVPPPLPQTTVDPWGFTTESEQENHNSKIVKPKGILIEILKPYWKSMRQYVASMQNFFSQAQYPLNITSAHVRISDANQVADLYQRVGSNAQHLGRLSSHYLTEAFHHLKLVQAEFRHLMKNFVSQTILDRLEKQELDTIEHLHALWCYFIFEPFRYERGARSQFFKEINDQVQKREVRLVTNFQKFLPNAQIQLSDQYVSDADKLGRILTINQDDGVDLFLTVSQQLLQLLKSVFGDIKHHSPEYYAIEKDLPYIYIVLLVKGKLLLPTAYRVMPSMFVLQPEPKAVNFMPFPIPGELLDQFKQLGIDLHDNPEGVILRNLVTNYATMQELLAHMIDIMQAELDDKAYFTDDVFGQYYKQWFARLQEECKKSLIIIDQISELIDDIALENNDEEQFILGAFDVLEGQRELLEGILSDDTGINLEVQMQWRDMLVRIMNYIVEMQIIIANSTM